MDMFSLLPESLLFIIVSSLPFKEAARTSILSKQWLHVWHSTTNIEFNELFFVNPEDPPETKHSQKLAFIDFINHFLDNYREPLVDKFCLKFSKPSEFSDTVQRCIAFASQRGVRQLELDFSEPQWEDDYNDEDGDDDHHVVSFCLPDDVYGSYNNNGGKRSLETLRLFSCGFSMSDLMKTFVGLKAVSFGYVGLNLSEVKELLFNNGGTIESLSLRKCWNLPHLDLRRDRNLNLRRLVIDRCNFQVDYIVFKAPNLRYLKYSGAVGAYEMNVDEALEEADLDFSSEIYLDYADVLYKMLIDLYPIKVLTVCSYFLQAIPLGEEPFRVHMDLNVKHLILNTSLQTSEFWGISFLLESCPSLHTLTLNLASPALFFQDYEGPLTSIDGRRFWVDQMKKYYECLRTSVEVVEMKGFSGSPNEYLMLHSLVKYGRVLKKLDIYLFTEEDDATRIQTYHSMVQYLLSIPKASPHLEIAIY